MAITLNADDNVVTDLGKKLLIIAEMRYQTMKENISCFFLGIKSELIKDEVETLNDLKTIATDTADRLTFLNRVPEIELKLDNQNRILGELLNLVIDLRKSLDNPVVLPESITSQMKSITDTLDKPVVLDTDVKMLLIDLKGMVDKLLSELTRKRGPKTTEKEIGE